MVTVLASASTLRSSERSRQRKMWLLFQLIMMGIVLVVVEIRIQYHHQQQQEGEGESSSTTTAMLFNSREKNDASSSSSSSTRNVDCDKNIVYRGPAGIPVLRHRYQLGQLLTKRKFKHGAEIGVQHGYHARDLLTRWSTCEQMTLIDLWGYQEGNHYRDPANRPQNVQDTIYKEAQKSVQPWTDQNKTTFYRMRSTEAAQIIPDNSLDFVYVDARHDYCGVLEDLRAYYPKLRPGGILSGHDFLSVAEQKDLDPKQDWSICSDGVTVNQGAVKGAVETFALDHGLSFSVMYGTAVWTSWMMQKPTRMECVQEGEMGAYGSDIVGFQR